MYVVITFLFKTLYLIYLNYFYFIVSVSCYYVTDMEDGEVSINKNNILYVLRQFVNDYIKPKKLV